MASQFHQNGGSSTAVMELQPAYMSPLPSGNNKSSIPEAGDSPAYHSASTRRGSSDEEKQAVDDSAPPTPLMAAEVKERWNYPRSNIPKVSACFYSFIVMGANDAAYGVSFTGLALIVYSCFHMCEHVNAYKKDIKC